jgi:hypothetical protein
MAVCMEACLLYGFGRPNLVHVRLAQVGLDSSRAVQSCACCFAVLHSSYEDWQRFLCDVEPFPGDGCEQL